MHDHAAQADAPVPGRRLLHTREVPFRGFLRDDGRTNVEERLRDLTAAPAQLLSKSIEARGVVDDMRLVMTIDIAMQVLQLRARTDAAPTPQGAQINAAYAALVGLQTGAVCKRRVCERVGGGGPMSHSLTGGLRPPSIVCTRRS